MYDAIVPVLPGWGSCNYKTITLEPINYKTIKGLKRNTFVQRFEKTCEPLKATSCWAPGSRAGDLKEEFHNKENIFVCIKIEIIQPGKNMLTLKMQRQGESKRGPPA